MMMDLLLIFMYLSEPMCAINVFSLHYGLGLAPKDAAKVHGGTVPNGVKSSMSVTLG